ncbi:hypothetical protein Gpo141_00009823 [Globisporangium polare]
MANDSNALAAAAAANNTSSSSSSTSGTSSSNSTHCSGGRRRPRHLEQERDVTPSRVTPFQSMPTTTGGSGRPQQPQSAAAGSWRRLKLSNAAQRILSSLVLAPLITYFLWRSPAFATTTVCAVVVAVSCYEYAWLAHRIQQRVGGKFDRLEAKFGTRERLRESSQRSNSSHVVYAARESHESTSSRLSPRLMDEPLAFVNNNSDGDSYNRHVDSDADEIQEETVGSVGKACAISSLARWCCFGSEWFAAVAVSLVGTTFLTLLYTGVLAIGVSVTAEFAEFQVYYAAITSFATCICASFSPSWRHAALLILQVLIFSALTVYSMKCPINNFKCDDGVHPMNFMVGGAFSILVFRVFTSRSQSDLLLGLVLDLMGYVYIIGSLFLIVSFVDIDREATYRKLVIALLQVVWASDSGAYLLGKTLEHYEYGFRHPLAPHLSMNKDYEGTVGAIVFGVCAMFLASDLLEIPGSVVEKLLFATCAVVVGRVGDLFESLLKRAAMVKDSGKLIPGHGGVLDRIDALMFAAIVFSRYFDAIIFPEEQR